MDLHFTDAIATEDECAAVDEILGPPESGWNGGARDIRSSRQSEGGAAARGRRDLLLPVLHAIQSRVGWISPGALNYISARLVIPPAETYGVATFYALLSTKPQPPTVIHICDDIACKTRGADEICAHLQANFGPAGSIARDGVATWKRSPCLGLCERAPAAMFQCAGIERQDFTTAPVTAEDILSALKTPSHIKSSSRSSDHPIRAERRPIISNTSPSASPHLAVRILSRVGNVDPASLDEYRASGGYSGLRRALEIGGGAVIRELADAKLTGRGGAAFPTHIKWKAVAEAPARPHYVVCNADESEPGTFKDRVLMEEDPFSVIEAITIAGYTCGADLGYIYIRGEYPEATRLLDNAIAQARNKGLLGVNIMARDFSFDIEIRRGGGAYICGEETALLESIEGKRGEPRNKPPFPVHVGLFGKPTAINNVETLVNVLPILAKGGMEYAKIGSEQSTGTRLFCVSGCIERPGVYELPYGEKLRALLQTAGGVRDGRNLQAILLGGAAGVLIRPDEIDMTLTLEGAHAANATLGSGVVLVFDDTVEMKGILLRIAAFFRDESCGQCVPCRVGTVRQEEALSRLLSGSSDSAREIALLGELETAMKDASICGLGHTAATAIMSAINRLGLFHGASL